MIVAITVTHNRIDTLSKTIKSLKNQTYKPYKIIIVDNGSSPEQKEKIKKISEENKGLIDLLELEENTGGAGGFYYGMKYSYEKYDPTFYWIMDDDAYPREDCLENLIIAFEELKNNLKIGALCPVIYGIDSKKYQLYHHKFFSISKAREKTLNNLNFEKYKLLDANAFVGVLIHRDAVKEVGFPDKDLFIYGDDTEYTFRISRKLKLVLVKNAVIDHQDPPTNIDAIKFWWKGYYLIRNRIFFIKKYSEVKIYDLLALSIPIYVKLIVSKYILKDKAKAFKFEILLQGIKDGLKGRKGKTLDPKEYFEIIKNLKITDVKSNKD